MSKRSKRSRQLNSPTFTSPNTTPERSMPSADESNAIAQLITLVTKLIEKNDELIRQNNDILKYLNGAKSEAKQYGMPSQMQTMPIEYQIDRACRDRLTEQGEMKQREEKLNNLVLVNYPEPVNEETDLNMVRNWLVEQGGDPMKVTRCFRMGKKLDDKHRPLKIILSDLSSKEKLYRAWPLFKDQKAFVRPDMTVMQRTLWRSAKTLENRIREQTHEHYSVQISINGTLVLKKREEIGNGKKKWVIVGDPFQSALQILGNDF